MGVSGTVAGSINLTFITDGSGMTVTGTGSPTASLPFGTVSMYGGTVPSGVTRTLTSNTSFTLSTPFDVHVDVANSASSTYTLAATLNTADATNVWVLGALDISAGSLVTPTIVGAYGTATPYTLHLTVPASETAGLITNSINFLATAN